LDEPIDTPLAKYCTLTTVKPVLAVAVEVRMTFELTVTAVGGIGLRLTVGAVPPPHHRRHRPR